MFSFVTTISRLIFSLKGCLVFFFRVNTPVWPSDAYRTISGQEESEAVFTCFGFFRTPPPTLFLKSRNLTPGMIRPSWGILILFLLCLPQPLSPPGLTTSPSLYGIDR